MSNNSNTETHFDLIVIGTGPAASTVARHVNQDGKRVAIVEAREFGGTCALRGCNPKKVYTNAATLLDQAQKANGKLARFDNARLNWSELLAFKNRFTEPIAEKSEASFQKAGIATFHGTASFTKPQEIRVKDQHLTAERFLIGVGATPAPLGISGENHVLQSDEFLELNDLPKQVVFIGGGYISMEFAHVAARYGSQVTILQRGDQVLKEFDPDLVNQLVNWSEKNNITVKTNAEVITIHQESETSFSVIYETQGEKKTVETNLAFHGAGRIPNVQGLNLQAAEVEFSEKGIIVDEFMRSTTNPAVFAAGDCVANGMMALTTVANEEARIVADNLFAESSTGKPDYGPVPSVAFTVPCLSAVGMLETEARKSSEEIEIHHENTSDWNSVRKVCQECAGYKLLIDKPSQKILGAHLLGPGAEETINLFTLVMKFGLTTRDIKSTLFAFPTFSSDVRKMV